MNTRVARYSPTPAATPIRAEAATFLSRVSSISPVASARIPRIGMRVPFTNQSEAPRRTTSQAAVTATGPPTARAISDPDIYPRNPTFAAISAVKAVITAR
jgi:hypothetical protein